VQVPSADASASWLREIETAPAALTAHAVVGLVLLGGAAVVVIQTIAVRHWSLMAAAAAGLAALLGAFGAGEAFVKDGSDGASLTMSVLASVALLCYIVVHAVANAAARRIARQS
jgi:ABC-type multidrug transport system permease subunit